MKNNKVNAITPFVPAKDYDLSLSFYKDLGFTEVVEIEGAVRLEIDGQGFWLQDRYVQEWADNCMFCLYIDDLELWWSEVKAVVLSSKYEGKVKLFSEPHQQEGSLMMQITDPTGVLWHVREGK